jgi:hypothetical protein
MALPLSPCGINCAICDAYTATQNNDMELKQKLAEDYKRRLGKEKPLDEFECDGCSEKGRHIVFCSECEIRSCVYGKGYATCADCYEFPCEKGAFIWTTNSVSKANLEAVKAHK